jgi:hypothetical protein
MTPLSITLAATTTPAALFSSEMTVLPIKLSASWRLPVFSSEAMRSLVWIVFSTCENVASWAT